MNFLNLEVCSNEYQGDFALSEISRFLASVDLVMCRIIWFE